MDTRISVERTQDSNVVVKLNFAPVTASSNHPDPLNARGRIREAGFVASINRDKAVVATVPKHEGVTPNWVAFEPDGLRGAAKVLSTDELAALLKESLAAAKAERLAIKNEVAARQQIARSTSDLSVRETAALIALQALSRDEADRVIAALQDIRQAN